VLKKPWSGKLEEGLGGVLAPKALRGVSSNSGGKVMAASPPRRGTYSRYCH